MDRDNDDLLLLELFLHRRTTYTDPEVLRLTRLTPEKLRLAIEEWDLEPLDEAGSRTFAWTDVAHLALVRWTPRMIARALGRAGAAQALPPLNRMHTIPVELPLYQIRLLHWLAESHSEPGEPPRNASDILEHEIVQHLAVTADD